MRGAAADRRRKGLTDARNEEAAEGCPRSAAAADLTSPAEAEPDRPHLSRARQKNPATVLPFAIVKLVAIAPVVPVPSAYTSPHHHPPRLLRQLLFGIGELHDLLEQGHHAEFIGGLQLFLAVAAPRESGMKHMRSTRRSAVRRLSTDPASAS